MRSYGIRISAMAIIWGGMASAGAVAHGIGTRPATVRVGINMTNLAFVGYMRGGRACGIGTDYESVATFSPHGRRFVVVVEKGNFKRGDNRFTILLWKERPQGPVGPDRILTMSSSTYYPGIDPATLRWSEGGRSLLFLGARGGGHEQLYRFQIASRSLKALTHSKTSLISFSMDSRGNAWAYGAVGSARSLWNRETMMHGLPVTTESLESVLFGEVKEPWAEVFSSLYVAGSRGIRRIQPLLGSRFSYQQGGFFERSVSMSPNGRYVIVPESVPNRKIPTLWRRYTDPLVRSAFPALASIQEHKSNEEVLFSRLVLVDLKTGRSRILLNVPNLPGMTRPVVWAPDSRDVVISRTLLPIVVVGGRAVGGRSKRQTVEVNIRTGAVTPVGRQCAAAVHWNSKGLQCTGVISSADRRVGRLLAGNSHHRSRNSGCPVPREVHFRMSRNGRWRLVNGAGAPALDVFLREGLNRPPELYYRRRNGKHARLLWNLNPQLSQIDLSRERLVTWDWSKGRPITAGLYYPADYQPGRRYPLVIQTHGFQSGRFAYWGAFPTSDAAQPLAADGMFVLQVNDMDWRLFEGHKYAQLEEVRRAIKIYRTVITYLAGKGLINPRRVGIIGFSHTCFFVDWALTHDPHLFAAASVTEGGDGSPMEYMLSLMNSVDTRSLYGGPPFGRTLKYWVKRAPIFHVNRVHTPLLLVIPHPKVTTLYEWEWLHGLRELNRPVQMLVLDGRIKDLHTMQVPRSIAVASGESVDWFDFWLNGQEPSGPATRREYRHWERLCAEQKRENPGRPVFCVTRRPRRDAHGGVRTAASAGLKLLQPGLARQVVHDARGRDGQKGLIRRQVAF